MIIKNFLKTTKWKFQKALTEESNVDCKNPGRGWYRVYSFDAREDFPREDWYWGFSEREQLALLMVDLGGFSKESISEDALANIESCFGFFKENKKELILRFVYDRKGEGMRCEPSSITIIEGHMRQLAPVLKKYETTIFCIQGLFVGNWGEMHGSKFLTERALKRLWSLLCDVAPKSCFLAVRKPTQWRQLVGEDVWNHCRLGLFNDGLLGSETDLGTYSENEIQKELEFQSQLCNYVPNGGEVVGVAQISDIEAAVEHFSKIHISYLNGVYDARVLNRWKNSKYAGINGYEYVGIHLGYRFVVKDICMFRKKGQLFLEMQIFNNGFSNFYENGCFEVLLEDCRENVQRIHTSADLRTWQSGEKAVVQVEIPQLQQEVEFYNVYLRLYREKDKHTVFFANEDAKETFFVGKISI